MWPLHLGCGCVQEDGGSLRGWAHCHLGGGLQARWEGQSGTLQEEDGVACPSPLSLPLPSRTVHTPSFPRLTHTSPSAHCHLLFRTCLSHRPTLGIRANRPAPQTLASSLTFYFSFCTAKYSFQMCLLTEVTFLVLLTCSFFLIYFATPPGSYSPRPHPPSSHPSEPLFFFF